MRALAATRSGRVGAQLAASRPKPVRESRKTRNERCGSRSPSGTSRNIPTV
jgi:hypothetical protein